MNTEKQRLVDFLEYRDWNIEIRNPRENVFTICVENGYDMLYFNREFSSIEDAKKHIKNRIDHNISLGHENASRYKVKELEI